MGNVIKISVRDKIAVADGTLYVCGNNDFSLEFDFDAEWDEFVTKTARFVYGEEYQDVVFHNNVCPVPVISDVHRFYVGVYAGDLRTTTPATVGARRSILCGGEAPAAPHPDVYAQLVALFDAGLDESRENANAAAASSDAASLSAQQAALSERQANLSGQQAVNAAQQAAGAEQVAVDAAGRAEELARQVGVGGGLQADWSVNDPAAPGYVHGRTHWSGYEWQGVIPETTGGVSIRLYEPLALVLGKTYRVMYNGVGYDCPCYAMWDANMKATRTLGSPGGTEFPFWLTENVPTDIHPFTAIFHAEDGATEVTFSVKQYGEVVHPIPAKFMPTDARELHLTSPGGTIFRITVDDTGALTATPVSE